MTTNHSEDECGIPTDENDEESNFLDEVLRIKMILDNSEEQSHDSLFDSLRRLQTMNVSLVTLKVTEIGKSVNALRKHKSEGIRYLVRALLDNWIIMIDAWLEANAGTGEVAKETVKKPKVASVIEVHQQSDEDTIEKSSLPPPKSVLDYNKALIEMKFEVSKRKMHEQYQEMANKQRTQPLEIHQLPKQKIVRNNQNMRPCNGNGRFAK